MARSARRPVDGGQVRFRGWPHYSESNRADVHGVGGVVMDAEAMVSALPSWRGGATRRAVASFLESVTSGSGAVPVFQRRLSTDGSELELSGKEPMTGDGALLNHRRHRDPVHDYARAGRGVARERAG